MKRDIENREDIDKLMRLFYRDAIADEKIGFIFTDIAKLDLEHHLPIIGDFWEKVLFGSPVYFNNPLTVHQKLHERFPLQPEHFIRWVEVFSQIVDTLFAGEIADLSKSRARAIADSLDKAHRKGVIHGGLNPSVVVLTSEGPKLLDFGVAAVAEGGAVVESVSMATTKTSLSTLSAVPSLAAPYRAPEQYTGGAADVRTDIFAFGAILYQMVTGRPAFQEKTQALLIAAIQTVDPEPVSKSQPGTPPALDYVVTRCLAKDPRQRFQTAFDVLMELQWISSTSVRVAAPVQRAARRPRRGAATGRRHSTGADHPEHPLGSDHHGFG